MPKSSIEKRYIFGDVHGEYIILKRLLEVLNLWTDIPSNVELIFLGDLIDRGPQSAQVVELVKSLCEKGQARCILGNHEFNFVQFNTQTHNGSGLYRRARNNDNLTQIAETWSSYRYFKNPALKRAEHIEWMKSLPIAIELDDFQMVHACWSPAHLAKCVKIQDSWYLSEQDWEEAWIKGSDAYNRVEILCKGLENKLPNNISFKDGSGKERRHVRIAWWNNNPTSWQEYIIAKKMNWESLPEHFEFDEHGLAPKKATLFGHYWFDGVPSIINQNAACLDYSVTSKDGILCAYEWCKGDKILSNSRLHWYQKTVSHPQETGSV